MAKTCGLAAFAWTRRIYNLCLRESRHSKRDAICLSSAINRSELVSEYRRIMPESSQAGIRDVDHPELKPTQCSSLLECDVVRFEARPSANSDLVCPVRGG